MRILRALVATALIGAPLFSPTISGVEAGDAEVDAYFARRIWTGRGNVIDDGVLVVVDGRIQAVGPRGSGGGIVVPDGARRHDLGESVIIPGLVAAETGLCGGSEDHQRAVTPHVAALGGWDAFADRTALLAGGVTAVQISPGSARLMPGVGAVVKLKPPTGTARVLREREGLRVILSGASRNPPTVYEPPVGAVSVDRPLLPTRPQLSSSLTGAVGGLRALFRAARAQDAADGSDPILAALGRHLASDTNTVRMTAREAPEIRAALELAREFDLRLVLVDPVELGPFVSRGPSWAQGLRGVILQGRRPGQIDDPSPEEAEDEEAPWEYARALLDAEIPVAVRPAADDDLGDLLFIAGQFRQGGLREAEVLAAITRWPAEMLGVADQIGKLYPPLDADFVVLSDDPFAMPTHVLATYVDGERVYTRPPGEKTTVIRADAIHTGDGTVLLDGALVVRGKTVRGLGDVSAPEDAVVKRFPPGAVVVPGFVDLGCELGVGGSLGGNVSLETRLGEQLDPHDPALPVARRGGVTTVVLGASGGSATPLVAFKLSDNVPVVGDPVAIRFELDEDSLRTAVPALERTLTRGRDYHQRWLDYEKALAEYEARAKAKSAEGAGPEGGEGGSNESDASGTDNREGEGDGESGRPSGDRPDSGRLRGGRFRGGPREGRGGRPGGEGRPEGDGENGPIENENASGRGTDEASTGDGADEPEDSKEKAPEAPQREPALEPYRQLFAQEIPAVVEARRADVIEAALRLLRKDFPVRTILAGVDDLARLPDLLEGQDVSVIVGPELLVTIEGERTNLPQHLANERIPFGFQTQARTGVRNLRSAVQFAVSRGLGAADALAGLTSSPARMLFPAAETPPFGSIRVGQAADLVVLSGPPFDYATTVLAVMIDGEWVLEKESERWPVVR